jgi:hypothetical protein
MTKTFLSAALIASLMLNGFLFVNWNEATFRNEVLNHYLEQVAKDLTKEKTDVEATLAECNSALATVQTKPLPPSCPAAPMCPPIPPAIVCPTVPAVPEPAIIATSVPPAKVIHKRPPPHRRHVSRAAPFECWGEPK